MLSFELIPFLLKREREERRMKGVSMLSFELIPFLPDEDETDDEE